VSVSQVDGWVLSVSTTLDIKDDVLAAAKELADRQDRYSGPDRVPPAAGRLERRRLTGPTWW
jgi:hypothetical protein